MKAALPELQDWQLSLAQKFDRAFGRNEAVKCALAMMAELALARGFQVNVHAIGDRGNRIALDAFESARPEIEHLLGALRAYGKVGMTCVGESTTEAEGLYRSVVALLDQLSASYGH